MTTPNTQATLGRILLNKVPEVTVWFWVIKVLATTVGETAADFLSGLGLGLSGTTVVMTAVFVVNTPLPAVSTEDDYRSPAVIILAIVGLVIVVGAGVAAFLRRT